MLSKEELNELTDNNLVSRKRRNSSFSIDEVKHLFQDIMDKDEYLIVEDANFPEYNTIVIKLDYVGDRWCKGTERKVTETGIENVPYTINYTSLTNHKITLMRGGENPFYAG